MINTGEILAIYSRIITACWVSACHLAVANSDALEHVYIRDVQPMQRNSISDVDLQAYTGFAKTIERSDFDSRYTGFGELLDRLPSIQVNDSGGFGSFTTVSMRGSTGKQVNFFLDGLLLNSASSGSVNIRNIPAILIEKIATYPDFTPAQLGNANLAGAVNISTREVVANESGAELSVTAGSFNTHNKEASYWGSYKDWQVIAALGSFDSDNNFSVADDLFRTDSKQRKNDAFSQDSLFLKVAKEWAEPNDSDELIRSSAMFQYADSYKQIPTSLNQLRDDASLSNTNWRMQILLDHNLNTVQLAHRFFGSRETEQYTDLNSTVGLGTDDIETEQTTYGVFNVATLASDQHQWVMALEASKSHIDQHDLIDNEQTIDAQRSTVIVALADDWQISSALMVNVTARYYAIDDSFDLIQREKNSAADVSQTTLQIGSQWKLNKQLTLKANVGRLIRIPTLSEKFGSRGLFEGDSDLKHEQSLSLDGGFSLALGRLQLMSSVYFHDVENGIVTIFDSRGVGKPKNIGEARVTGLESQLFWQPNLWLTMAANVAVINSENKSNIRSAKGKNLPGIYHKNYGVNITASDNHIDFMSAIPLFKMTQIKYQINYQFYDDLYYNLANSVKADVKEDLSFSLTLYWQRVSVDITARNIFDKNFLDVNRFPSPGRSYLATLTFDF